MTGDFGAPGPLNFVFAADASLSPGGLYGQDLVKRILATAMVAALALVICAVTEFLRQHPAPDRTQPVDPACPLRPLLRVPLAPR